MTDSRVNYKTQDTSQMKQKSFYNNAIGFKMDTKALAEFVAKVMDDKDLTERDVAEAGGTGITHAHVNKIKNERVKDPGIGTLQALARGLKVSEELLFAIARGKSPNGERIANERFARICDGYVNLPDEERERLELTISLLETTISRFRQKTSPHSENTKEKIAGKVLTFDEAKADNERKTGRAETEKKQKLKSPWEDSKGLKG